jgi:formylglycine-generating enzyme required for sulfatase activity
MRCALCVMRLRVAQDAKRKAQSAGRKTQTEVPMRRLFLIMVCLLFFLAHGAWRTAHNAYANNISISSVTTGAQDTDANTLEIQFDLSWENAWKDAVNYDAAWIFIKYSTDSGATWKHATLKTSGTNPTGFSGGTATVGGTSKNLDIIVPTDKMGAFAQVSSAETASGTLLAADVTFVWDYGTDIGTDTASDDTAGHPITTQIRVMAIEMAYIPQGAFYVGSGGTESGSFTNGSWTSGATIPLQIASEDALTIGQSAGNLWGTSSSGNTTIGPAGTLAAAYPKGFGAFYIMKYDISQGQYADFLNVITSVQASSRYPNQNGNYRHTISGSHPSYSASRPDRACNYLSWADLYAYADWAGLRPFTELEYEKAARGTASAVANEYAWGTATIVPSASLTISGAEDGTETITTDVSLGACLYGNKTFSGGDGGTGPLRCGIFAKSDTTRITSGASYYGVMDLSGGLWKRPVTVGNAEGRVFTGIHGDGDLTTFPSGWPSSSTAAGSGFRGGGWHHGAANARVSDRYYAAFAYTGRSTQDGGRCARTP